jgi:prepilin-type N-terminal cleavage/methylation domain-containing protein
MKNTHMTRRNRGFTIIELMITMTITSFMILGSVTFLVSARQSNQLQTALSDVNSSGRFGLDQISRDLRMSGYREEDWTAGALDVVVSAIHGESADGGDSISIVYEGFRDCAFVSLGTMEDLDGDGVAETARPGLVTNVYRVLDGNLLCNDQSITSGIEEMQVYFGEDTDANESPNRWVAPDAVGLNMERVVSVRVHLLASTSGNSDLSRGVQRYWFDNAYRNTTDPVDDGQIRREYLVTVALRNPT